MRRETAESSGGAGAGELLLEHPDHVGAESPAHPPGKRQAHDEPVDGGHVRDFGSRRFARASSSSDSRRLASAAAVADPSGVILK